MTSLFGWTLIILAFVSASVVLLYPCYRVARRSYPDSRKIEWIYGSAAVAFSIALWLLLPLFIHRIFGHAS